MNKISAQKIGSKGIKRRERIKMESKGYKWVLNEKKMEERMEVH
jgi:hypothetical protein